MAAEKGKTTRMTEETFLTSYGYLAVWIGTLFEGETILLLAGFFAHQGYMRLWIVILVGFLGTVMSDQFFFHLGRRQIVTFFQHKPGWDSRLEKVRLLLERHSILIIIGFRFLYGLRTITPVALGMSGVGPKTFSVLNVIGAALWATVFGSAGYFFGKVMETFIEGAKKYEAVCALALALLALMVWVIQSRLAKRDDKFSKVRRG